MHHEGKEAELTRHEITLMDQRRFQNIEFQGLKGSERCQIMLHVDIDTLRAHTTNKKSGQAHCNLDNTHWISPKTAKRLACDATLITVLEDDKGKVLNIGRRSRTGRFDSHQAAVGTSLVLTRYASRCDPDVIVMAP